GEFGDAKLFAEDAGSVIVLEDPVVEAGFDAAGAVEEGIFCGVEQLLRAGQQRFAGAEELEFVAKLVRGARAGKFGGLEFAGRKIDEGESDRSAGGMLGDGSEEIVFAGVEDGAFGRCARCDDADYFAADYFFAGTGLLHLVANGNLKSGADEAGDVPVGGVV